MNRVCALPVIFLLGSLAGIAQSSPTSPAALAVLQMPRSANNDCPVGIQVKEGGIPRLVYIKTAPPEGPAAGLRISVRDSRTVGIVRVWITVRGYAQAHASSTDASNPTPGLLAKSFALPLKVAPGGEVTTELWAKGFVGIASVELTRVAYADGSAWRSPAERPCRISPPLHTIGTP